jgi:putative spermidine/putrescine transport system substrate-binding protein
MTVLRTIPLLCLAAACLAPPAAAEDLVVATFGGTFVDNSKKCHAAPFEKATGAGVKYVLGSSVQTAAKLRAAGARAEFDVAYMDSQIVKQAKAEGLLQPLDSAKIAHWGDLYDASRDKDAYWVSMMFAGTIIT